MKMLSELEHDKTSYVKHPAISNAVFFREKSENGKLKWTFHGLNGSGAGMIKKLIHSHFCWI